MFRSLTMSAALLIAAGTAQALTIESTATSYSGGSFYSGCYNNGGAFGEGNCMVSPAFPDTTFVSATSSYSDINVATTASASVDVVTGIITGRLSGGIGSDPQRLAFSPNDTSFRVDVTENFTVSGTGTVTAKLTYSADIIGQYYDHASNDFVSVNLYGSTRISNEDRVEDTFEETFTLASGSSSPTENQVVTYYNDSITRALTDSFMVTDGTIVPIRWQMIGRIGGSLGTIDLTSARFSIETTGDVVLTPSNSAFLSQPVAPVPLPAGVWMLLGALAGLAGLKRLRRPRAA